jgi:hypothetical protein
MYELAMFILGVTVASTVVSLFFAFKLHKKNKHRVAKCKMTAA